MSRYVGHLHVKGHPDQGLASYSFEAENGKKAAVDYFLDCAEKTMESEGIASATLVMTEDDRGLGSRDLERAKHKLRD